MSKKAKPKTSAVTITQQEKFALGNAIMLDQSLSPATRLVGWFICDHINTQRGYAWPPQTKIAADLGLSRSMVKYAVKSLARYFDINRSGRNNEYRIGSNSDPIRGHNLHQIGSNSDPRKGQILTLIGSNSGPHPSNDPLSYPFNSALAAARAASTDVDVTHKQLAQLERELKKESGNRQKEIAIANRDLIDQIFTNYEPGDSIWERANRLCEEYPALEEEL